GPIDGEEQGARVPQKLDLLTLIDLTNEVHARLCKEGLDLLPKVNLVGAVDLGSDLQRNIQRSCNSDSTIGPFFGRYATKKGNIVSGWPRQRAKGAQRKAVINGLHEIRSRHWPTLIIRDRNQGHVIEAQVEWNQIG